MSDLSDKVNQIKNLSKWRATTNTNEGMYTGELRNGKPEGHGELIFNAGNKNGYKTYLGQWTNGNMNGMGKITGTGNGQTDTATAMSLAVQEERFDHLPPVPDIAARGYINVKLASNETLGLSLETKNDVEGAYLVVVGIDDKTSYGTAPTFGRQSGFKEGMIIMSLNNEPVKEVADVVAAKAKAAEVEGKKHLNFVVRDTKLLADRQWLAVRGVFDEAEQSFEDGVDQFMDDEAYNDIKTALKEIKGKVKYLSPHDLQKRDKAEAEEEGSRGSANDNINPTLVELLDEKIVNSINDLLNDGTREKVNELFTDLCNAVAAADGVMANEDLRNSRMLPWMARAAVAEQSFEDGVDSLSEFIMDNDAYNDIKTALKEIKGKVKYLSPRDLQKRDKAEAEGRSGGVNDNINPTLVELLDKKIVDLINDPLNDGAREKINELFTDLCDVVVSVETVAALDDLTKVIKVELPDGARWGFDLAGDSKWHEPGLVVMDVKKDSIAEKYNIKKDMLIVSVNSKSTHAIDMATALDNFQEIMQTTDKNPSTGTRHLAVEVVEPELVERYMEIMNASPQELGSLKYTPNNTMMKFVKGGLHEIEYVGEFSDNMMEGEGIMRIYDKRGENEVESCLYVGEFSNNMMQGTGIINYRQLQRNVDKEVMYVGSFENGLMHGTGKTRYKYELGPKRLGEQVYIWKFTTWENGIETPDSINSSTQGFADSHYKYFGFEEDEEKRYGVKNKWGFKSIRQRDDSYPEVGEKWDMWEVYRKFSGDSSLGYKRDSHRYPHQATKIISQYKGQLDAVTVNNREFIDGAAHGQGYKYGSGVKYFGGWKNGEKHGVGTMMDNHPQTWGNIYVGNWVDGMQHGHGRLETDHGSVYEGDFLHGQKNGKAIEIDRNNHVYKGQWREGKFVSGKEMCTTHCVTHEKMWEVDEGNKVSVKDTRDEELDTLLTELKGEGEGGGKKSKHRGTRKKCGAPKKTKFKKTKRKKTKRKKTKRKKTKRKKTRGKRKK